MNEAPAPLVPAGVDLRDFPFMPVDIARLFGSTFHASTEDGEWRAGVTLWLKSFHQVPAASLPNDDVALARLAELGRDVKSWRKLRAMALHGWVLCSDDRWYHPVVAEKVLEAWQAKLDQRTRTAKARVAMLVKRLSQSQSQEQDAHIECEIATALQPLSQRLSQTEFLAYERSVTDSVTETKRKRQGQGQGQGQESLKASLSGGEGCRLPPGWTLPKTWGEWALGERPGWNVDQVRTVAAKFRDHWLAAPGLQGIKADWEAAWRNWVRNESTNKPAGALPPPEAGWWTSANGIETKGRALGVEQLEGELFPTFKARVLHAAGDGPWRQQPAVVRDATGPRKVAA